MSPDLPTADDAADIDCHELVRALIRISSHLTSDLAFDARMGELCRETAALLGCDRSSLMLWDGQQYQATHNWGNPPDLAAEFFDYRVPPDAPLMEEMRRTGTYVVVNDAPANPSMGGIAERARIASIVLAPMSEPGGSPLGFLTAEYTSSLKSFDERHAELVLGAASFAQTAVVAHRQTLARQRSDRGRRRLLTELLSAESLQRRRIGQDIHDDALQRIFGLFLRLQIAHRESSDAEQRARLADLVRDCREASESLRSILREAHPSGAEADGLVSGLTATLDRMAASARWDYVIDDELTTEPSPTVRSVLLRIGQQALQNVFRHAEASNILVVVREVDGGLLLAISDDGRGFDTADIGPDCFGLLSMSHRAEDAGGRFVVDSAPGSGTTVEAWVPDDGP